MKPRQWVIIVSAATLLLATWLAWPVYQFYAHRGAAPMLPFGWHRIDGDVPSTQEAFDPRFEQAGSRAQSEQHTRQGGLCNMDC